MRCGRKLRPVVQQPVNIDDASLLVIQGWNRMHSARPVASHSSGLLGIPEHSVSIAAAPVAAVVAAAVVAAETVAVVVAADAERPPTDSPNLRFERSAGPKLTMMTVMIPKTTSCCVVATRCSSRMAITAAVAAAASTTVTLRMNDEGA